MPRMTSKRPTTRPVPPEPAKKGKGSPFAQSPSTMGGGKNVSAFAKTIGQKRRQNKR